MRLCKIIVAVLLLTTISLHAPAPSAARPREGKRSRQAVRGKPSEAELREEFSKEVVGMLHDKDFDRLEKLSGDLLRDKSEFPSGGRKMAVFYEALGKLAKDAAEESWPRLIELHQAWVKAKPQSLTARLVQANGYISYAWHARGEGYADTVTPKGARLFDQRLHVAEGILDQAERLPGKDPELCRARMVVGRGLGCPRSQVEKLLQQALKIDPAWRGPIGEMAIYLLPQWYGKPGDLENFADEAVELTKQHMGTRAYATVVAVAIVSHWGAIFDDFKFSWEKTKQAEEDALKRYPQGETLASEYCFLACAAGDRAKARELFEIIDHGKPDLEIWQKDGVYEHWRHWSRPNLQRGGQRAVEEGHHERIDAVAFLPDGTTLLTAGGDGRVAFRDPKSAKKRFAVRLPGDFDGITAMAVAADPPLIATGLRDDGICFWDAAAKQTRTLREIKGGIDQLAFSPDGKRLAVACGNGALALWNVDQDKPERVINDAHERETHSVQFSPDGKLLATCGGDGMIKLWDAATGKVRRQWRGHKPKAFAVAFFPDGKRLASGGSDHCVRIWTVPGGEQVGVLEDCPSPISCLAISADGKRLAAGTRGGPAWIKQSSAFVWDVGAKKLSGELVGHKGAITGVAISPDGKTVATVGYDMTVRLWDMPK